MLKLCSNLSNILFKGGQIMKLWKKGIILGMVVALAIVCVPEMYVKADEVPTVKASVISSANLIEDQSAAAMSNMLPYYPVKSEQPHLSLKYLPWHFPLSAIEIRNHLFHLCQPRFYLSHHLLILCQLVFLFLYLFRFCVI